MGDRDRQQLRDIAQILERDQGFRQKKEAERQALMADSRILYYAGIGSRATPTYILDLMTKLAEKFREDRFILRTGHAPGADQAFERGACTAAQIFLPWSAFEQDVDFWSSPDMNGTLQPPAIFNSPTQEARIVAAGFHPVWDKLKPPAKLLHARNVHQILGPKPQSRPTPVEFVICWTADGQASGGTGMAISIAEAHDIPVYNLQDEDDYDLAFEWVWGE